VPIVLGLIVLVGIVAVLASRGSSSKKPATDTSVAQQQPVSVVGTPLVDLQDPAKDAAVGAKLPDIHGKSFDGSDVDITADGTPKLIFFVAHWCPHCQREVPLIVDWLKKNGAPKDVGLYSVATGTSPDRPNYPPSSWLAREGWPIPVVADDAKSTAAAAAGLTGYPFFVAVDGKGAVVARTSGEITMTQLEQLIAGARAAGGQRQQ
jgi:thiol-disulfide isomerase/thioredoxin